MAESTLLLQRGQPEVFFPLLRGLMTNFQLQETAAVQLGPTDDVHVWDCGVHSQLG